MVQIKNAHVIASGQGRLRIASRSLQAEIEREWLRHAGVGAVYANPLTARVPPLFANLPTLALGMNSGIGCVTERRAESSIASLAELVDDVVPVLRDGAQHQVEGSQLTKTRAVATARAAAGRPGRPPGCR
jgi:hypothetical protein